MHPNRSFRWEDGAAMLAFVRDVSFATIAVSSEDGPVIVHAPVLVAGPGRLRFHIARGNRALAAFEAAGRAAMSWLGPDAYVSPDWYGTPDQVGTWNYLAVEAEGPLRPLSQDELVALLDALSDEQEARLAPKPPWTREKMRPGLFEQMLRAIVGFEMEVEALRGTRKFGQHKSETERRAAADAVEASGRPEMAALMREGLA